MAGTCLQFHSPYGPFMPIGILTLHTGYNEGAVLQALALSRLIEATTDETVEILDHQYPVRMNRGYGPADTPRKQSIAAFAETRLALSPRRFEDDHRPTWRYAAERYKALVVGSDEVWKVNYRARLRGLIHVQSDPMAPPYPNVYWPDASAGPVRVAYAATIGAKTVWKRIPERRRRQMAETLSGFHALGLRDERTQAFLKWVSPETAVRAGRVPDPTLGFNLLDEKRREPVRKKLEALGVDFSRPRAVVIADTNEALGETLAALRRRGVQTVALSYACEGAELDLSKADIDPLEWADAIGMFDLAISERMHGCIFSLLNGTPLLALDSRPRTLGFATKNEELIDRFGLQEFFFPLHDSERATPENLTAAANRLLDGAWPAEAVTRKLEAERQIARDFLGEAFSGIATGR